jgi:hypothetical protein
MFLLNEVEEFGNRPTFQHFLKKLQHFIAEFKKKNDLNERLALL